MPDMLSQIFTLLNDVIVPQLQSIHTSQALQRLETDRLNRNIEEFRNEMHLRFAAIHAEIAACRQELEDTLVTVRERDGDDNRETQTKLRKRTIH
jgi:hypothetical protein